MDLPVNNKYCTAVDEAEGKWIDCTCGCRVTVRNDSRTYTLERFIEHCKENAQHREEMDRRQEIERLEAKRKLEGDDSLTNLERQQLKMKAKKATRIDAFFTGSGKSKSTSNKNASKSTPTS